MMCIDNVKDRANIRDLMLFKDLTGEEYNIFLETVCPKAMSIGKDQPLVAQGDEVDSFWIVISGQLAESKTNYDGDEKLLQVYTSGDAINLNIIYSGPIKNSTQIFAVKQSEIMLIKAKSMIESKFTKNLYYKLYNNLIYILVNESTKLMERFEVLIDKTIRARILTFLTTEKRKCGSDSFKIDMNRDQLASYLAVERNALSRELSYLRSIGLIDFHKRRFEIIDSTNPAWVDETK